MQKSSLTLFFLVMFAIGTDTFLISPLLPVLRHEFHVSTASSGWMVSAYALGYALFALVAGPISDRLNRKHVMVCGMAAFSISTGLCAAAVGFWSMVLFRFLAGVSAAVISPQIWASIPILLPPERILQGMGIATAGLSIAQMLGLPLGSFFAAREWSLPFIVIALFSLLLTLLLLLLLPSIPSRSPSAGRLSLLKPYAGLLSSRTAVTAFAAYFIFQIGNFAAFSFLGSWLSGAFGLNIAQIGQVMLFLGIGNMLGSLFGSRLSMRFGRFATLLLGMAVNSVMFPLLSLTRSLSGIKAELLVIFGIAGILFPIMISILQTLSDTARGTVSALTNALMYLGTTIGAAAAGGMYQASGMFVSVTLLTSLCFIISIFLFHRSNAPGMADGLHFSK
ncbi:putative MFS family arabinose efflux permease [Paenibacillus forsythiae]|uniref:MFS family arabinose efflux permease n=1 Tax=Paenibacillus forsythiae TaxID=365616 RepID=A0ABU3H213_9BACL|nr:MFS transporter [Paenibacillus forsythiae]MDT3424775.1 putative MFS family arabinose efflux permease [Paenibacillus forsythiae]